MVYVDELRTYPDVMIQKAARKCGNQWCHMTADTVEELHAFATQIGMKREWFQDHPRLPHYDLTPRRRADALRMGAIFKEAVRQIRELREKEAAARWTPPSMV